PAGVHWLGVARLRVRQALLEGLPRGVAQRAGAGVRGCGALRAGGQARGAGAGDPGLPGFESGMTEPCNIAAALPRLATAHPDRVAIRCPGSHGADGLARYDLTLTHAQLDARSDAIAAG